MDENALHSALARIGHGAFRPGQLEAVQATLAGRDSLLILPTGGGKSVRRQRRRAGAARSVLSSCRLAARGKEPQQPAQNTPSNNHPQLTYQLPPVARGGCITVVVSPLLALASDQVRCMHTHACGRCWCGRCCCRMQQLRRIHHACTRMQLAHPPCINTQVEKCLEAGVEAAKWNSSTSDAQRRNVISELASDAPDLRLLYTTPESLLKPGLRDALKVRLHGAGMAVERACKEVHGAAWRRMGLHGAAW